MRSFERYINKILYKLYFSILYTANNADEDLIIFGEILIIYNKNEHAVLLK